MHAQNNFNTEMRAIGRRASKARDVHPIANGMAPKKTL